MANIVRDEKPKSDGLSTGVGGKYNAALPTLTDGDGVILQTDINGKLLTSTTLVVGDIEIGAVELKDGTTDARQAVKVDNATATATPTVALTGGIYKDSADTYDDNDAVPVHMDVNGNVKVDLASSSGTGDFNLTEVGGSAYALGTAAMVASIPVTIASDDTLTVAANALLTTIDTDTGVIAGDTTSIDGKTPVLGQAVKASSVPVAIASDQDALAVTQLAPVETSIVDTTDVAATTTYYPAEAGKALGSQKNLSFTGKFIDADETVTLTIQATNDDEATPASNDWIDLYFFDSKNNTNVNTITVTNGTATFAGDIDNLNKGTYRYKVVTGGATNTIIIKERLSV